MIFQHKNIKEFTLESVTTDVGRHYTTPEGNVYESVTTWLGKREGKKESLEKWRERIGHHEADYISKCASERGNDVHEFAEFYLKNEQPPIVDPVTKKLVNQLKPMLEHYIQTVYGVEYALYSDELKLAGRTDCVAKVKNQLAVVDFKTSSKPKRKNWITDYFIQTATYARMINELYGTMPSLLCIFIAVQGTNRGQVFIEPTNRWINHKYITSRIKDLAD
jgi:genome maintenance exonuclease 1